MSRRWDSRSLASGFVLGSTQEGHHEVRISSPIPLQMMVHTLMFVRRLKE